MSWNRLKINRRVNSLKHHKCRKRICYERRAHPTSLKALWDRRAFLYMYNVSSFDTKSRDGAYRASKKTRLRHFPGALEYKDEIYNVGKDILCDIIYQIKKGPKALFPHVSPSLTTHKKINQFQIPQADRRCGHVWLPGSIVGRIQ
jgi:hypothetical protein